MSQSRTHITAIIDGEPVRVRRGETILDAARKAGIYIPTLCYLEGMKSYGGCRLCLVDIKGGRGFPTACTTPVEPGMEILTRTPEIQSLRRNILEMTLSEHPYTCLVCKDKKDCGEFMHSTRKAGTITGCNFCTSNGDCELQDLIDFLELDDIRYPIFYRGLPPVKSNPFYDLDYNLCVHCGRCVRICNEERNSNVLAFVERGNSTIVGTAFGESQADAGCEFCGACVDVCPTGSISGKLGKWAGPPTRSVKTTCTLCSVGCSMNVNTRAGRLVDVGPAPGGRMDPPQLCLRGKFLAGDITQHPSRITVPMIRKNGRLVEVDWDEAIKYTTEKLATLRGNGFGVIGSAQDTLEENYSLQKFSRVVMNSNNIDLISSWPDPLLQKDIAACLKDSGSLADIMKADTLLVLGADASVSHPLVENKIRKAYNAGRNVLYANSHPTRTSKFSSMEINYSECMDYNFLYVLLTELASETISGLPAGFAEQVKESVLLRGLKTCSVDKDALEGFVSVLSKSQKLCIVIGNTLLRGETGRQVIKTLMNIRFLKGEKSRCKTILLGDEGNLLGGSMAGAHPGLLPGLEPVSDKEVIRKWNKNWGAKLNNVRGLSQDDMIANIGRDGISSMMIAGDLAGTGKPGKAGLKKLKFLVQLNMFKTSLTEQADVFLPVNGFLENDGHFMAFDNKVLKLRKTLLSPGKSKSIPEIVSRMAEAMKVDGFSSSRTVDVWKEFESNIKMPVLKNDKPMPGFELIKPPDSKNSGSARKSGNISQDHYRYRGNKLSELVDDLQVFLEDRKGKIV